VRALLLATSLAFLGCAAEAADLPQYSPVPAWVKAIPIPDKPAGGDQSLLLQVSQARFGAAADEIYDEEAFRIKDPGDLTRYGNVILPWQPDTETLVIHKLELIRDGKVIDQLDQGRKVQILHRETNLEKAMFDGTLTATVQLEGLQVGDVVHIAFTREVHDPVLKGHSQLWSGLARPGKIGHAYISAAWPASKPLRWKATEGMAQPQSTTSKDGGALVVDLTDAEALQPPRGAPARFGAIANVQMSDFASWAEVSALIAPLFDKASTLEPDSPLKAEIAKIKAQSSDPKVQAAAALKLVEDRIRYLFIGLNNGNLVPAAADETWRRRFGDCKAKTALLLALLRGLGIQAQPALVDTTSGDAMQVRLPSLSPFDHVAVKARIGGKTYWLDGTRLGDSSLDELETPNYHWMLPVQATGAQLEELKASPFTEAHFSARLELDASAGLDTPAKAHGEHQWRGDGAQAVRLKLQAMSDAERERTIRGYWQQAEPWITPTTVTMKDDGRILTLVMDGTASMTWGADNRGRTFVLRESNIGGDINFQRQPGPSADAPFAVDFPSFTEGLIKVTLPNKGVGFTLFNSAPIDQVVAGEQYRRTATIQDGAAVIQIQRRSVAGEFPFAEATTAAGTLRNWGLHAIMIVSDPALADAQGQAKACNDAAPDEALKACQALLPKIATLGGDAAAVHAQMGHLYGIKRDWPAAIDSFTKALAIKPDFPRAIGERAAMYMEVGDLTAAMADLDRALALDEKSVRLWALRGFVYAAKKDNAHAIADFGKALALTPGDISLVVARGQAYIGAADFAHAAEDADRAVALDPKRPEGYALRGQVLFNQKDLAKAELAYGQAISIAPKTSAYWMDRGLVRTALKHYPDALADYDEALKLDPNNAAVFRARAETDVAMGAGDKAAADRQAALHAQSVASQAARPPAPPADYRSAAEQVRAWLASGQAHADRKEFALAIADYDQALLIVKRHPDALAERGKAHAALGEWVEAVADFDQVLTMRPKDADILADRAAANRHLSPADAAKVAAIEAAINPPPPLPIPPVRAQGANPPATAQGGTVDQQVRSLVASGRAHSDRGELDLALKDFDQALSLAPRRPEALIARGDAFYGLKQWDKALADLEEYVSLRPTEPVGLDHRGLVYAQRKDIPRALADFDAALKANPNYAEAHNNRGFMFYQQKDLDKALVDYNEALRLRPDYALPLKNRADLYIARKEFPAAIDDYTSLVNRDGANAVYRYGRGAAYVNLRNGPKALDDLDVAVKLDPNNARYLVMRAAAHSMAGEYEEAVADSDTALKIAPNYADAYVQKSTAERRLGKTAEADADSAKAKNLAPAPAPQLASSGAAP
jgi:tetratricopeptide (TPR) repeat protein